MLQALREVRQGWYERGERLVSCPGSPNCDCCRAQKEANEQAAYWRSQAKDTERQLKSLLLEKKELVSKLEKLRRF